jgi:hypothetical protein
MIALGWTVRDAAAPPLFTAVDLPQCAVIGVAGETAATPRDRLRLQVACARTLHAFLPLRPSDLVTLEEAAARARIEGAGLAARLADLAGRVQVTLSAEWTPSAPEERTAPRDDGGRRWLAARAAAHAALADRQANTASTLRAALSARMRGPVAERPHPRGLQLDGLVDASGVEDGLAALARDLVRLRLGHRAKLTVTGPWPVLSFADLPGRAA